jgi:hypothetical protein
MACEVTHQQRQVECQRAAKVTFGEVSNMLGQDSSGSSRVFQQAASLDPFLNKGLSARGRF